MVVVTPQDRLDAGVDPVIVVASTRQESTDYDRIELVTGPGQPDESTGLPSGRCRLLPRWYLPVPRSKLVYSPGESLSKAKLYKLLEAVQARIDLP